MVNNVSFPVYAFLKDDWSMFLIESPDNVLCHIEQFHFEKDEYLFWNAQGRGVHLKLERGTLTGIEEAENEMSVHEAFARYAQCLDAKIDLNGPLPDVWGRIQANVKPPSAFERTAQHAMGFGCLLIVVAVVVTVIIGTIRAFFLR